MHIAVAGLTGAGKTTLCREFVRKFQLEYVSATRLIALHCGLAEQWSDPEFWPKYGDRVRVRLAEDDVDDYVNSELVRIARSSTRSCMIDSWFLPWLVEPGLVVAVWLESSLEVRLKKVAISHNVPEPPVPSPLSLIVQEKDQYARDQLFRMTGASLHGDIEVFDAVIDVDQFFFGANPVKRYEGIKATAASVLAFLRSYEGRVL